jgi:hypothetical protein
MANTYTWSIPKKGLITMSTLNGQSNVVVLVRYTVTGTDGTHTFSINDTVNIDYTSGAPFTPFANLTETQVLEWIKASDSNLENNIQAQIDARIANAVNPPIAPTPVDLPWTTT